jgi:hypothetical protein
MTATIDKFISEFERKFQAILQKVKPDPNTGARYADFFECFEPRKKYSDWDLKCWLKEEAVTVHNLKSIESFVRSFDGFADVGILLSFADEHRSLYHHIDNLTWLQLAAFMPSERRAPFVDLHIEGVTQVVLADAYAGKEPEEFVRWAMLITWRKYKNGNPDANVMLENFVLPSFPESLREYIKSNPTRFFKKQFSTGTYERASRFLQSE